jgi:hypothetical protein
LQVSAAPLRRRFHFAMSQSGHAHPRSKLLARLRQ